MSKAECDEDVMKYGTSLGFVDCTKEEAEEYCIAASARTGNPHDWHYVGGRVHVKVLLPENVPPECND